MPVQQVHSAHRSPGRMQMVALTYRSLIVAVADSVAVAVAVAVGIAAVPAPTQTRFAPRLQ